MIISPHFTPWSSSYSQWPHSPRPSFLLLPCLFIYYRVWWLGGTHYEVFKYLLQWTTGKSTYLCIDSLRDAKNHLFNGMTLWYSGDQQVIMTGLMNVLLFFFLTIRKKDYHHTFFWWKALTMAKGYFWHITIVLMNNNNATIRSFSSGSFFLVLKMLWEFQIKFTVNLPLGKMTPAQSLYL